MFGRLWLFGSDLVSSVRCEETICATGIAVSAECMSNIPVATADLGEIFVLCICDKMLIIENAGNKLAQDRAIGDRCHRTSTVLP